MYVMYIYEYGKGYIVHLHITYTHLGFSTLAFFAMSRLGLYVVYLNWVDFIGQGTMCTLV